MSLEAAYSQLLSDLQRVSLPLWMPELVLILLIVALLLARLLGWQRMLTASRLMLFGSAISAAIATQQFSQWLATATPHAAPLQLFSGLLLFDGFALFIRVLLLVILLLAGYMAAAAEILEPEDLTEFYVLLLGSTLGLLLMPAANHLLVLFLALEMTSVPSYILAGFMRGRRHAGEAALKYIVYGGGAAGILLYGISLLAGLTGTVQLNEWPERLHQLGSDPGFWTDGTARTLLLAWIMVVCGLAFKLSLVPFQFWCPDVFEGATTEVAAYLSVGSKTGALAMLVRICLACGPAERLGPEVSQLLAWLGVGLGLLAILTTTFGNLGAYPQTNLKRLLAYSTIGQAGFLLMPLAALLLIRYGGGPEQIATPEVRLAAATRALACILYYLIAYFCMKFGAFAVVAAVRNRLLSQDLGDWRGIARQSPGVCVCLAICMFSLVGLPPLAGFFAKLLVFASLYEATPFHPSMWLVLIAGLVNTVVSLFYYLRVLRAAFFETRTSVAKVVEIPLSSNIGRLILLLTVPTVVMGIGVEPVLQLARRVAEAVL